MANRAQNRAARRAARRRPPRRRRLPIFPLAVGALIIVGGALIYLARQQAGAPAEPPEGVITRDNLERSHVEGPVEYEMVPPVGGPHWDVWWNCGFYDEPAVTESAVHSLEHSAVWITYDPELPERDIDVLRGLAQQRHMLVSPWEDPAELPSPVVASAWGAQLHADGVDDPRIEEFIDYYRFHQDAPEPRASCENGLGEPQ